MRKSKQIKKLEKKLIPERSKWKTKDLVIFILAVFALMSGFAVVTLSSENKNLQAENEDLNLSLSYYEDYLGINIVSVKRTLWEGELKYIEIYYVEGGDEKIKTCIVQTEKINCSSIEVKE